jgi:hypothetical protein
MTLESPQLSHEQIEGQIIDDAVTTNLLKRGLIKETPLGRGTRRYEVTPLGIQYVSDYESFGQELEPQPTTIPQVTGNSHFKPDAVSFLRSLSEYEQQTERVHLSRVSLLIPALNEAQNITLLLNSISKNVPEIRDIIVVDRSVDETAQVARGLGARVIIQDGVGKGDALRQAFASKFDGDIVVTIDADGSNRTQEIPRLVEAILNGADIAKGSRFMEGGGSTDLSLIRRIGNYVFVSLVNLIWPGNYTDLCYGFLAIRKDALMTLTPHLDSKYFEIETEICIEARKLGLKVVEVPSIELKRVYGASKLRGVHDSFRIMRTIFHELVLTAQRRIFGDI